MLIKKIFEISFISLVLFACLLFYGKNVEAITPPACSSLAQIFVQRGGGPELVPGEQVHCSATAQNPRHRPVCQPDGTDTGSCTYGPYSSCVFPEGPAGFDCSLSPYDIHCEIIGGPRGGYQWPVITRSLVNGSSIMVPIVYPPLPIDTPTNTPIPNTPTPFSCGSPCSDDNSCQNLVNCNKCLPDLAGIKHCVKPPACGDVCSDKPSDYCTYAPGCNICRRDNPGDALTCMGPPGAPTATPTLPPQSTPPPTSTVAPSATPTVGVCVSGQTQCSNCNGDPAHCTPDCSGGWCNGGICQTCQPGPGGNGNCSIGKDCGPPRAGVSVTPGPPQSYWLNFPDKQGLCVQSAPRSPTWPVERCVPYTSPTVPPPTATATPIPATPTPIQPTSVISMIPTPTNNPNRPHPTSVPAKPQRWVCLRQEPCSNPSSGCSVLDDHRVKLSVKTDKGDDAKPLAGKPTYIFECLQLGNQRICTTGVETTDIQAVGVTHLQDKIVTDTGYQYNGIFMDTGAPAINPIPADQQNNGDFGVREWKSYSDVTIPRIFLAMNDVDANTLGGDQGALQQGILALVQGGSKSCVQIQWDPYGEVLNKWNLQPVSGAQVILYKKSADGAYSLVTGNDVMGMFQNPISTDQNGTYNFIVPDGTYKVNIKAPGYELYQGSDIVQKDGKAVKHDVKLVPQSSSLIDKVVNYLQSSFISQ